MSTIYIFNETSSFIREGTQLLESTTSNGKPQVKIKTILQTCDDVNQNKRIYPKAILQKAVANIRPMLDNHTLVGELDHPVPTGSTETDSYRHFVVLYDRTSHIIEDIFFEGNLVMGIVKTTSTDKGYNMAGLIQDGIPIGFSLRASGESEPAYDGIMKIKEPFNIVTYDCVSNPSHTKARMQSVVSEGINPAKAKALVESAYGAISLDRGNLLFNTTSKSRVNPKLDQLLEKINAISASKPLITENKSVMQILESYINSDTDNVVHNKVLSYLEDYLNPGKTKDLEEIYNKYFS